MRFYLIWKMLASVVQMFTIGKFLGCFSEHHKWNFRRKILIKECFIRSLAVTALQNVYKSLISSSTILFQKSPFRWQPLENLDIVIQDTWPRSSFQSRATNGSWSWRKWTSCQNRQKCHASQSRWSCFLRAWLSHCKWRVYQIGKVQSLKSILLRHTASLGSSRILAIPEIFLSFWLDAYFVEIWAPDCSTKIVFCLCWILDIEFNFWN